MLRGRRRERTGIQAASWGTHGAFLSTFGFQAPELYRHHGYQVFGALRDYPPGHTDCYLQKRLGP
jgi:hypothetical protein